jgi:hypothetical protein
MQANEVGNNLFAHSRSFLPARLLPIYFQYFLFDYQQKNPPKECSLAHIIHKFFVHEDFYDFWNRSAPREDEYDAVLY